MLSGQVDIRPYRIPIPISEIVVPDYPISGRKKHIRPITSYNKKEILEIKLHKNNIIILAHPSLVFRYSLYHRQRKEFL